MADCQMEMVDGQMGMVDRHMKMVDQQVKMVALHFTDGNGGRKNEMMDLLMEMVD